MAVTGGGNSACSMSLSLRLLSLMKITTRAAMTITATIGMMMNLIAVPTTPMMSKQLTIAVGAGWVVGKKLVK